METRYKGDGQKALFIHLPPEEEITFQIFGTEVIFTEKRKEAWIPTMILDLQSLEGHLLAHYFDL